MTKIFGFLISMSNIKFAFFVIDMTSLRYAVPFIKLSKSLHGIDVALLFDTKSTKYNSIRYFSERIKKIAEENEIICKDITNTPTSVDTLFCVENGVGLVHFKKCYAFQHAFDYLYKTNFQKVYLVTSQYFKDYFSSHGIESKIQPFPVVFWDWDNIVNFSKKFVEINQKSCVMFYPQAGYVKQFRRVYDKLQKSGYRILVKQRRKHQPITEVNVDFFYDDIWYPSESIFLPAATDLSVGFETSAYTDIVHLKKDYVDFSFPAIRNFYKPDASNMHVLSENFEIAMQQFERIISENSKKKKDLTRPFDINSIKEFLGELLQ